MQNRTPASNHTNQQQWITQQVNAAINKLHSGQANFIEHEEAKRLMSERKAKIRGASA